MNHMEKRFSLFFSVLIILCVALISNASPALTDTIGTRSVTSNINLNYITDPAVMIPVQEHEVKAGLLYDIVNKKIVWQKNSTAVLPIASLTKMMVALLAIEDLRAGKFNWNDTLSWSHSIVMGRKFHHKTLTIKSSYSFQDVFKAMMIASDNQCAEQMATYIGDGDLNATIQRMNIRALALGMTSTVYRNPSGLPASIATLDNASTPVDQLILGLELLKYQEVLDFTGMGYAQVTNGKHGSIIRNHNGLTIQHPGEVDGLKTGYTKRAGFCLVGTASKCNHRLIAVVLGCRGPAIRNEVVKNMFNTYYTSLGVDPIGNYNSFTAQNIATSSGSPRLEGQWVTVSDQVRTIHVVRKGENISKIAQRYHCSVSQLRSWNRKKVTTGGQVRVGEALAVYTATTRKVWMVKPENSDEGSEDQPTAGLEGNVNQNTDVNCFSSDNTEAVRKEDIDVKVIYHTVIPGDTLYSIARKYGLANVKQLKELNQIHDHRVLLPGMKLKVSLGS